MIGEMRGEVKENVKKVWLGDKELQDLRAFWSSKKISARQRSLGEKNEGLEKRPLGGGGGSMVAKGG